MSSKRLLAGLLVLGSTLAFGQSLNPNLFSELRWRDIGPNRGGRTRALAGVPSQPNVFYIAQVNGGIWKTDDYGHTWNPIFDDQDTGSIGSLAVAPSNANVIYAGSGEGLQRPDLSTGDGIYKSTDAGKTWTHLGLRDGQQIPKIAVDPRDENRIFAAVLGHPYGPNEERGLYRSTDGGAHFEKVLSKNENTGANDVVIDPVNPDIVYTAFWEARQGPWENSAWSGTDGGVYKSTDGGTHWKRLGGGLPEGKNGLVQANLAISLSDPKRLIASVATADNGLALYRSDNAGNSWQKITDDPRPAARIGGGDLPVPTIDPKNPDIVYSASVVTWRSIDGVRTWTGIRGAPGGDDYQGIWINPNQPDVMLVVSDQGAIVTVNGGRTWSDWYNQPTAQMYHVSADNAFPYRVCSGQQESGSACVSSRGNDGEITFREWHPVGVEEYGNAVPDPKNPDYVYGGKVTRYNRLTTQVENVGPKPVRSADYRTVRTAPLVFSPIDGRTLYFASNTLWKTIDGARTWHQISPDLTRKTWTIPGSVGKYRDTPSAQPSQRGVIYTIAPSPLDANRIWVGSDDGLVNMTADGGSHWKDVTPKQLVPWAKVSIAEASHFDRGGAYLAINTFRLDDLRPHLYRTHDGGATWTEIVNGIPENAAVNVIREDTHRKGLLFAGSERAVFISFDDGDHWQSLRLNMPATSIRDLLVKGDDLVAATHGRGFWILDDITPLRQAQAATEHQSAFLFTPQHAVRVRPDTNTDTPLPPDVPAGKNPPAGAVIDYYLATEAEAVTLDILNSTGQVIRHYSSTDASPKVDPMLPIPTYWVRPPHPVQATPGMHRFTWDLHLAPITTQRHEYPMQAIYHDTAPSTAAPWVMPGHYSVRLTAGDQKLTQPIVVEMDPRVKTSRMELEKQFAVSSNAYRTLVESTAAYEQVRDLRAQLEKKHSLASGSTAESVESLDERLKKLAGESGRGAGRGTPGPDTLASVNGTVTALLQSVQEADVAPTLAVDNALSDRVRALGKLLIQWNEIKTGALPRLNAQLRQAQLQPVQLLAARDIRIQAPSAADDDEQD